ncbi:MAG: 30S ribosome-binding factor RbfA [Alphaproteobacteria bacterium]|nr:30S ribosome-binding factor RbfA [Alphaproteobacteria bacterium]
MRHKHHTKGDGPSQRQLRVGEQIRQTISETLQRGHFGNELLMNKSHTLIVSEVRPSPDLRHALAFVMSLNGEDIDDLVPALNSEAAVFQKDIARGSNLKFTPRIKFVTDTSFDEAQHIEDILKDVKKDD